MQGILENANDKFLVTERISKAKAISASAQFLCTNSLRANFNGPAVFWKSLAWSKANDWVVCPHQQNPSFNLGKEFSIFRPVFWLGRNNRYFNWGFGSDHFFSRIKSTYAGE